MLTELFAQLMEEGSVTVYTADDCMTALKGVLVTDEFSNLWFMNRTFAWSLLNVSFIDGEILMAESTKWTSM